MIIKKFDECLKEIEAAEKELKKVPMRIPSEEVGQNIKIFEYDYREMVAEIRKFTVIKNLTKARK
jgi:hypothetical protein